MSRANETGPLRAAQVSARLGIPAATLRSWERRYAWPRPQRTGGGHRRYSKADVEHLEALRDEIVRGRSARDAVGFLRALGERMDPRLVERVLAGALQGRPNAIRRALQEATERLGIERAVTGVAVPALRAAGLRWEEDECEVGDQHTLSRAIQAWMLALLESTTTDGRAVVFASGPGERHALALLGLAVLVSQQGPAPVLLGAPLTPKDLIRVTRERAADATVVIVHLSGNRKVAVAALRKCAQATDTRVLYGGDAFVSARSRRGLPGAYLGLDLVEAARRIGDLTPD